MTGTGRTAIVALTISFLVALSLSVNYCQRYIEFDVAFPSASWLHLYASSGGEATQYKYKETKVVSNGKPVHVRLPLIPMHFDALIISLDRPGGGAAFTNLRIVNGSGTVVSSIKSDNVDTSASGYLVPLPDMLRLTPTGLSETLDIRINFRDPLPNFPEGAAFYFLKMFFLSMAGCFFLFQGLRLLAARRGTGWMRGATLPTVPDFSATARPDRNLLILTAGLFLIILGVRLALIRAFGSDLPFWDQWDAEAAHLYIPYFNGTLSLGDLLAPHNEHRIFLTRLALLGQLLLNGKWDPLLQMVLNAAIYSAVCVFIFRSLMPSSSRVIWSVFAVLIFSLPFGWQNTLAGFQLQVYLMTGLSLLFIWFMTCAEHGWSRWTGGGLCAVLLLFTMASGFLAGLALFLSTLAAGVKRGERNNFKDLLPVLLLCALLVAAGLLLKAEVPRHSGLQAHSFEGFTIALAAWLGWPLSMLSIAVPDFSLPQAAPFVFVAAIIFWAPFLLFFHNYMTNQCRCGRMNFIVGAAFWVILQAVATAYARGGVEILPSRYQDIFAIGLLINAASLLFVLNSEYYRKRAWRIRSMTLLWLMGTTVGLVCTTGLNLIHDLPEKRSHQQAGIENVQAFLATGDIKSLQGKPFFDVPSPNQKELASLLNNQDIRRSLASSITGSADQGKLRPLTDLLLGGSALLVLSGIAIMGLYAKRLLCLKASAEKTSMARATNC